MKLSRVAPLLTAGYLLACAAPACAEGGTITFHGNVTAASCEIDGGGPMSGGMVVINNSATTHGYHAVRSLPASFTVGLPSVGADALAATGQTAGWSPFAITLSHCGDAAARVRVQFDSGRMVDMASGRLNLDTSSSAGNVQIALRERGATQNILIGGPRGTQGARSITINNHGTTLVYEAGYYATGRAIPGQVRTSVVYSLAYY